MQSAVSVALRNTRHAPRVVQQCSSLKHAFGPETINQRVLDAEYAVRGRIVLKAEEIKQQLQGPNAYPFEEVIMCNIGNPHALLQAPITFHRDVLSVCLNPGILQPGRIEKAKLLYEEDVVERSRKMLEATPGGFGAYSHSQGLKFIREHVAEFIEKRDGFASNPDHIFLTNGASDGIAKVLKMLIRDNNDGVLVPIPQYPLYSATLTLCGGSQLNYYLDEENGWACTAEALETAVTDAKASGKNPRAIAVINPGNPTGQVMSQENMQEVVRLCKRHGLVLLADEVYQENIYTAKRPFTSFKKVLRGMGGEAAGVELFSFHSTSKGFLGECGMRGGYMEAVNIHPKTLEILYKLASISLCSNLPGQLMVDLMVNPPKEGEPSYIKYVKEKDAIISSLRTRSKKMAAVLNQLEGVTCNQSEGAMYVFPRIRLPKAACDAAAADGIAPDVFYAEELLKATGICVVPGSGFGQKSGTWHFRTTFLPSPERMDIVIQLMTVFHANFMAKYKEEAMVTSEVMVTELTCPSDAGVTAA